LTHNPEADGESPSDTYRVVRNDEEQYSIWPIGRDLPKGWQEEGTTGTKEQCLTHIDAVWTDITPLSVRRALAGDGAR
jgi:MbtH protein